MWGRVFHSLRGDMRDLIHQSAAVPFAAWGSARAGEDISEYRSVQIIWDGRAWRSSRPEGTDHKNRRSVRKSARGLVEVRPAVGRDRETKLPAVDRSRATETARLDRIAFPRGSHSVAPALTDFGARHATSAGSPRPPG